MNRPGSEPRIAMPVCSAEELSESYEELAEVEPAVAEPAEDAETEGDALELVGTLEGGEGAPPPATAAAPGAGEAGMGGGRADAETFAVLPELDLLEAILVASLAEAPDEVTEEPEPARHVVLA